MRSTSQILINLENVDLEKGNTILDDIGIQRVTPTRSLLITSMPCEERAAIIRNKTIDNMEAKNILAVSRRYLQNKTGERNTIKEALLWGSLASFLLSILFIFNLIQMKYQDSDDFFNSNWCILTKLVVLLSIFATGSHVPPNIANTMRYKETKNACEKWLENKNLSAQCLNKIKNLPYDESTTFKLDKILKEEAATNHSVGKLKLN